MSSGKSSGVIGHSREEREYYVVHDGGNGDGMIEEGPFALPTKAVKAKNRLNRTSHFICEFRVQEVDPDE